METMKKDREVLQQNANIIESIYFYKYYASRHII